jgi:hypothetical protein
LPPFAKWAREHDAFWFKPSAFSDKVCQIPFGSSRDKGRYGHFVHGRTLAW